MDFLELVQEFCKALCGHVQGCAVLLGCMRGCPFVSNYSGFSLEQKKYPIKTLSRGYLVGPDGLCGLVQS